MEHIYISRKGDRKLILGSLDEIYYKVIQIKDEKSEALTQQELYEYVNSLSEEEFSIFEFNQAEEEYLS